MLNFIGKGSCFNIAEVNNSAYYQKIGFEYNLCFFFNINSLFVHLGSNGLVFDYNYIHY